MYVLNKKTERIISKNNICIEINVWDWIVAESTTIRFSWISHMCRPLIYSKEITYFISD